MAHWGLAAALAAPAVGVLLYAWLHERPRLQRAVDWTVYIGVPVLVAWQVLSSAWSWRSVVPLVAVVLGMVAVGAVERALDRLAAHAYAARADDAAILTGLSGIALHALAEGAALAPSAAGTPPSTTFTAAVALHRPLVGLLIWWLVRPRHGPLLASLGVAMVPSLTLVGYLIVVWGGSVGDGLGMAFYRAFVAGTLLHVVFHQGRRDHDHNHDHGPGPAPPPGR